VATAISEHGWVSLPSTERFHVLRWQQDDVARIHRSPRSKASRHTGQSLGDVTRSRKFPSVAHKTRAVATPRGQVRANTLAVRTISLCNSSGHDSGASDASRGGVVENGLNLWARLEFGLELEVFLFNDLPLREELVLLLARGVAVDANRHAAALVASVGDEVKIKLAASALRVRVLDILHNAAVARAVEHAPMVCALLLDAGAKRSGDRAVDIATFLVVVVRECDGGVGRLGRNAHGTEEGKETHL